MKEDDSVRGKAMTLGFRFIIKDYKLLPVLRERLIGLYEDTTLSV